MYSKEIIQMSSAIEIQALVRNMDDSFRKHRNIKNNHPAMWAAKIKSENKKLYDEFPGIYQMHMEGKLDETFFYMLQMKRKIEKGEITEDQASIAVGQKLFNRYVDPVVKGLPKPPSLSYSEYYKENLSGPTG